MLLVREAIGPVLGDGTGELIGVQVQGPELQVAQGGEGGGDGPGQVVVVQVQVPEVAMVEEALGQVASEEVVAQVEVSQGAYGGPLGDRAGEPVLVQRQVAWGGGGRGRTRTRTRGVGVGGGIRSGTAIMNHHGYAKPKTQVQAPGPNPKGRRKPN